MSKTQMTTEHENSALKDALFGRFGIVSGLNLIEACLVKAANADHGDAPAALGHNEAKLWHRAQEAAYRHVLEMVSVPTEVRALEHSMPVNFASQIHDGPVREGDVFRLPNGDALTALEQKPGGVMQVRIQGKGLNVGDYKNSELKALPRIGRAEYLDGTYSTPDWMYADGARARIRELTQQLADAKASAVVEFPDWRAAEGFEDPVSPAASGNGRLEITGGGWGAALIGKTPSGREFKMHIEFDADTPKFTVYPPSRETGLASSDEPVLHAAVLDDAVLVSTGYGPTSTLYHPQGILEDVAPFSGEEAMQRTRHPLYGLHKSVVLEELGYEFQEDSGQAGMWIWTAPTDRCESSFHTPKEAVDNAWADAKQQAMAIAGLSEEEWETKHFDDKVDFLRQTLGSDDAAPAPR